MSNILSANDSVAEYGCLVQGEVGWIPGVGEHNRACERAAQVKL